MSVTVGRCVAMSSASVDRLLALLIAGLVATGLVSLWQGAPAGGWVFLGHAWLAGMLALAVAVKLRASVPRAIRARRWGALALSAALTFGVVAALVGATCGRSPDGWSGSTSRD